MLPEQMHSHICLGCTEFSEVVNIGLWPTALVPMSDAILVV
jgi:hypothetical protein